MERSAQVLIRDSSVSVDGAHTNDLNVNAIGISVGAAGRDLSSAVLVWTPSWLRCWNELSLDEDTDACIFDCRSAALPSAALERGRHWRRMLSLCLNPCEFSYYIVSRCAHENVKCSMQYSALKQCFLAKSRPQIR